MLLFPLHRSRDLQLVVDLGELGIATVVRPEVAHPGAPDLCETVGVDRSTYQLTEGLLRVPETAPGFGMSLTL